MAAQEPVQHPSQAAAGCTLAAAAAGYQSQAAAAGYHTQAAVAAAVEGPGTAACEQPGPCYDTSVQAV